MVATTKLFVELDWLEAGGVIAAAVVLGQTAFAMLGNLLTAFTAQQKSPRDGG